MAIKEPDAPAVGDKGLQAGALGLVGNIVIGLAAVAPAYSLAATLGYVVLAVGDKAPSMFVLSRWASASRLSAAAPCSL